MLGPHSAEWDWGGLSKTLATTVLVPLHGLGKHPHVRKGVGEPRKGPEGGSGSASALSSPGSFGELGTPLNLGIGQQMPLAQGYAVSPARAWEPPCPGSGDAGTRRSAPHRPGHACHSSEMTPGGSSQGQLSKPSHGFDSLLVLFASSSGCQISGSCAKPVLPEQGPSGWCWQHARARARSCVGAHGELRVPVLVRVCSCVHMCAGAWITWHTGPPGVAKGSCRGRAAGAGTQLNLFPHGWQGPVPGEHPPGPCVPLPHRPSQGNEAEMWEDPRGPALRVGARPRAGSWGRTGQAGEPGTAVVLLQHLGCPGTLAPARLSWWQVVGCPPFQVAGCPPARPLPCPRGGQTPLRTRVTPMVLAATPRGPSGALSPSAPTQGDHNVSGTWHWCRHPRGSQ